MENDLLVHFRLIGSEAQALRELATQEWREPRDQVRFVLRQELERRGLLPVAAKSQPEGSEHDDSPQN